MTKEWFSTTELVGLRGRPIHRSNVIKKAEREGWLSRPRQGKGGGSEYHYSSLPPETQRALGFEPSVDKTEAEGLPYYRTGSEPALLTLQIADAVGLDFEETRWRLFDIGLEPIRTPGTQALRWRVSDLPPAWKRAIAAWEARQSTDSINVLAEQERLFRVGSRVQVRVYMQVEVE
jgi:hypothetical protein